MFHLLLDTDLGRAQTAEECLPRWWITQSFIIAPHRRILGRLRWHKDYNRSPRVAGGYCLAEHGPRALSSVVNLIWICDGAPESSLGAVVTPLQQTYTLMPCMGMVRNAGHVLHLLTGVHPPCSNSACGLWLGGRMEQRSLMTVLWYRMSEYGCL